MDNAGSRVAEYNLSSLCLLYEIGIDTLLARPTQLRTDILVVTISSNYDQENGFIEIVFNASPAVADYQEHFPEVIRVLDQENVSRVLLHTNFSDRASDDNDREFSKFVFADLNRRISHLAVLCPESFKAPIEVVIEPIISQGKQVRFFTSRDDAVEWLAAKP